MTINHQVADAVYGKGNTLRRVDNNRASIDRQVLPSVNLQIDDNRVFLCFNKNALPTVPGRRREFVDFCAANIGQAKRFHIEPDGFDQVRMGFTLGKRSLKMTDADKVKDLVEATRTLRSFVASL